MVVNLTEGPTPDGISAVCFLTGLTYSSEAPKAGTVGAAGGEIARRGLLSMVVAILVE